MLYVSNRSLPRSQKKASAIWRRDKLPAYSNKTLCLLIHTFQRKYNLIIIGDINKHLTVSNT